MNDESGQSDRLVLSRALSEKEITWCRENRRNPKHGYLVGDFIDSLTDESFELVFSQGTIDNVYNMDAWLRECVRRSRQYIYITAYRGGPGSG